jgi:hypothetical protein
MIQAYVVGDYVQYGDRLWQCIKNNIGQVPPNSEYWLTTGVPSSGTAFINLPYSVSYPGNQTMPQSTDGWYVLRVLDVEVYNGASAYEVDDIVDYTGGLYKCILDAPAGNDPTDDTYWAALSDEEVANLYDLGYVKVDTIPTILSTNMLITRYVKQKHIYDLLVKTNYKKYDDLKTVIQLEKICSMREAAIIYLRRMDPVRACDMLDQITIDVNSFTVNNGERTNFANATIFTI